MIMSIGQHDPGFGSKIKKDLFIYSVYPGIQFSQYKPHLDLPQL